jgi:hypothetical protein
MPVETFAVFAAEQAVGIAVGAIAVVAAPKVGPKLGSLGHDLLQGTKTAVHTVQEKSGLIAATTASSGGVALAKARSAAAKTTDRSTALVTATPITGSGVLAKPVAAISEGVHWYGEQWSDLVEEARAELAPAEEASAAETLANLTEAKIVSDLPGRARLRLRQIKGNNVLGDEIVGSLVNVAGIEKVQAKASTGSLLVIYDTESYASLETLLESVGE